MSNDQTQPEIGAKVTYFDGNGETHRALVADDCPDDEFITAVIGEQGDLGKEYNHSVESESSVYPHADLAAAFTATTYAFKPGWDA